MYERISAEVQRQDRDADLDDIEDFVPGDARELSSAAGLRSLISQGIDLVQNAGDEKWIILWQEILAKVGDEKVVLFAQPIETVSALSRFLQRTTGRCPAIIIGGQDDAERQRQVALFRRSE